MSRRTWFRRLRRAFAEETGTQDPVTIEWNQERRTRFGQQGGGYFVVNGRAIGGWGAETHEAGMVALAELYGDNAVNRFWTLCAQYGNDAQLGWGDSLASRANALAAGMSLLDAVRRFPLRIGTRWLM